MVKMLHTLSGTVGDVVLQQQAFTITLIHLQQDVSTVRHRR
jgi:hypothetical protein